MNPLNTFSPRAKNRTESAAMNGGMEIALTIVLFVLLGMAIDSWLGTKPVFVIALFLFAAIGSGLRYYYTYTADMERLEAEMAERRRARTAAARAAKGNPTITTGATTAGAANTESSPAASSSTAIGPRPDREVAA